MNKSSLLSLLITASFLSINSLPAFSLSVPETISTLSDQVTIPQSSALIISFAEGLQLDIGQLNNYPFVLPLSTPILDSAGRVIAPAGTLVNVNLVRTNMGVQIVGKSLIINGQVIPIQAKSEFISIEKVPVNGGLDKAKKYGGLFAQMGSGLGGSIGNTNIENVNRGGMAGQAFGLLIGLISPEATTVLTIPPKTQYILTLETAINLPIITEGSGN
jgi:hypothetical protein